MPSGLDATTGVAFDPTMHATATMTLALPKQGLRCPEALPLVGELYLADISVPPALYGRASLGVSSEPIFAFDDILRIGRVPLRSLVRKEDAKWSVFASSWRLSGG